jgi:predicted CXXCH cytochrome family protein
MIRNRVLSRSFLAALALAAAARAVALDPPHDASQSTGCQDCHRLHVALGSSLTAVEGNTNLCQSCHSSFVDPDGRHFGFPWTPDDQAAPGATGHSHRWDADVTNRGARVPLDAEMARKLDLGKVSCSTCHEVHGNDLLPADPGFMGGRQHVGGPNGGSVVVGTPWTPDSGGSGRMNLAEVAPTATPKGYRIRVSATDATTVRFKISHDRGKTWAAWSGSAWVTDTGGTGQGRPATAGDASGVALNDGDKVKVAFPDAAVAYAVGAYWELWISYPAFRAPIADDAMCVDCHADRAQGHLQAEGRDPALPPDGTTVYSHPVGEPISVARNHRATPLDADGSASDGNASNDLRLDDGVVRCTTCHAVHNVDSNSLTVDR